MIFRAITRVFIPIMRPDKIGTRDFFSRSRVGVGVKQKISINRSTTSYNMLMTGPHLSKKISEVGIRMNTTPNV